jgi:hypothetical protein
LIPHFFRQKDNKASKQKLSQNPKNHPKKGAIREGTSACFAAVCMFSAVILRGTVVSGLSKTMLTSFMFFMAAKAEIGAFSR